MPTPSQRQFPGSRLAAANQQRWIGQARFWFLVATLIGASGAQANASQSHPGRAGQRQADDHFACGGKVERQSWALWDDSIRDWARKTLNDRLKRDGDIYVLYDMQTYLHNVAAMARRCQRIDRLKELASIVQPAYESLEPGGWLSQGRRWVCRGGRICNGHAGLLGQEVMLVSVQFLGLASSIANGLASSRQPLSDNARSFIHETSLVISEHMLRWGDGKAIGKLAEAASARAGDVKSASTGLLFTDKSLWMIGIYAEWAGMLKSRHQENEEDEGAQRRFSDDERKAVAKHLRVLLKLFAARLTYRTVQHEEADELKIAELDRGYWRHFTDHRYAGYEGADKPLLCPDKNRLRAAGGEVKPTPLQRIDAASVPSRSDVGWDLSHARRLVHVLDALERNRTAMTEIFDLKPKELPPEDLAVRFANALVALSWNADRGRPLFRNYLSGANGWYRVGYATAGSCNEGTPPFGLSESFVTGGYPAWGGQQAIIRQLGRRLYQITARASPPNKQEKPDKQDNDFIAQYYPAFSASAPSMGKALSNMMFLPSLVGVAEE